MPQYLLDTDTCIYFLQGKFNISKKIEDVGLDNCSISEITVLELMFGAAKSQFIEKNMEGVKKIEALFNVIPIYPSFLAFAEEKTRLQNEGKLIPDFDLLIGCTAIANNMLVVTNNVKHLERLDGIQLENWADKSFNEFV